MATDRKPRIVLIAAFLLMIYTVGIAQAVIDLSAGDPPQVLDLFREMPAKTNLRSFEAGLEKRSWFERTLRPPMQHARFLLLRDAGSKAVVGRDGWWFYRRSIEYLIQPPPMPPGSTEPFSEVVHAVRTFRDQLDARGIRLLVVPVPGKPSVYPDKLTRRVPAGAALTRTHTQHVIAALREAGVEVVDLHAAFSHARAQESTHPDAAYYLPRDTHWTPAGARLAADDVADRILSLGWAQRGTVNYDTRIVRVRRAGDIIAMLRVPSIERMFDPETIRCEQIIEPRTGEPYRDDPGAQILVLGDSFLRIYERDEPGSAGFIAHLACALRRPIASIVNDGGASTLVRQELARRPELLDHKSLVVWEFVERDVRFGLEGWKGVPLP